MISIIICSRNTDIDQTLKENIKNTIGCLYELIVIDNSQNNYSIFAAYNEGVRRAQSKTLCFMHEDIEYKTYGWGNIVLNTLKDNDTSGCVAIGSTYVRKAPSYTNNGRFTYYNILHEHGHLQSKQSTMVPVITFDGFWFCLKKDCFDTIYFDEKNYNGFHFYDMDLALQLFQNHFSIVYTPHIKIFHSYGANFNKQWLINSFIFYKKWKHILPLHLSTPQQHQPSKIEKETFELEAIYTILRQIILFKKFDLLATFFQMVRDVLGVPALLYVLKSIIHHNTTRKWHR